MNIQEAIATEETDRFLRAANEFCNELELGTTSELDFCNQLFIQVSNLIFRASQLPNIELDNNEDFDNRLTTDELQPLLSQTSERLGTSRFYWTKFNPIDDDDMELVAGDLLDDLADMYADIKPNLDLIEHGRTAEQEHALWELKFFFETHWGKHAVDALRTLYFLTKN
ncbi:DUF5063 domain-containing protein [Ekhidna sp.]|uniref:DUF5063 domain-containing protein n=1 Tax=Ekhidna sp. TaxID=2608089 RepID=UPI003C7E8ABA